MQVLRLLVPLVVAGAFTAKVALDRVSGRRSGRADPDGYGATDDWSGDHDGCSGDHGGDGGDGGHC